MTRVTHTTLFLLTIILTTTSSSSSRRDIIQVKGGPDDVVWVVQLSDLHFSVHHPDRARDFNTLVGPALSFINPSLVLITGDLTDGKSKDLLTMKQDEEEWREYRNVMEDVVKKSGLDKSLFYDLRGNHDNFGVPSVGSSVDFFSNYSLNAQLGRDGNVNSVTLQTTSRRHLFVGIDTTMAVGLRGPTNLFGHPTDELLAELDSELSQLESEPSTPVTKISFGHFPLSFSAATESGRTLKDIFLKHSITAYLCGHLHARFGKNLKRYHQPSNNFIQLNMHQISPKNYSKSSSSVQEFWEWEMGDWRKRRAMRVVAIDRGHTSFVDIDFKSETKKTIVLPTFPLDSRLMWRSSLLAEYEDQSVNPSDYTMIRSLVFSSTPIMSVVARVHDSLPGKHIVVLQEAMTKVNDARRGALYAAPWNFKVFSDPSPDRYWLQIEAIDIRGRSAFSVLRPFSVNGGRGSLSWTWTEFKVMGCQWAALYFPILWFSLGCLFFVLLLPVALLTFSSRQYTFQNFCASKGIINGVGWVVTELRKLRLVWLGILGYLFYLVLCPWFSGQLFTDGGERGYMTYKGWVVKHPDVDRKLQFIGFPDIMVIIFPHIVFVVFPSLVVAMGLAVEREMYRTYYLTLSGKKVDDHPDGILKSKHRARGSYRTSRFHISSRWIRKLLIVVFLALLYKHFKSCRAMMKAYEMNPLLHFPVYAFSLPLLLAYAIFRTSGV